MLPGGPPLLHAAVRTNFALTSQHPAVRTRLFAEQACAVPIKKKSKFLSPRFFGQCKWCDKKQCDLKKHGFSQCR